MQTPPLTRVIGSAERAMRVLLERKLQREELSFAEWTILVFTSQSPLESEEIVQRQIGSHVVSSSSRGHDCIDALICAGLIARHEVNLIAHTKKGAAVFKKLSREVEGITRALYGDLAISDLEVTYQTLAEISKRANQLLAKNP